MEHDEGFSFGIGAFETMSVVDGRAVMLDWHLGRLNSTLEKLGIDARISREDVLGRTRGGDLDGRALKVEVSERNVLFSDRPNPYDDARRAKGFRLRISDVRRNETSPFTYMKSLQYGDSIVEKRRAMRDGFDEPLFLNSRGEICEGATTNIFFVEDGGIVTPPVGCGMLPGTMRAYVIERFDVQERIVRPEDMGCFEGCFVTNSLMDAIPVASVDGMVFNDTSVAARIHGTYLDDVRNGLRCGGSQRLLYA